MKILLISDYSVPRGGNEIVTLALREGLRVRGHDIRLFASRAHINGGGPPAEYHCFGTASPLRAALWCGNLSAFFSLRHALAEFRPDVVHVRLFLSQLSPLILPLLRHVPSIYHDGWYRTNCPIGTRVLPDGRECRESAGSVCFQNSCVPLAAWPLLMMQLRLWRHWHGVFDVVVANSRSVARWLEASGLTPVEVATSGGRLTHATRTVYQAIDRVFGDLLKRLPQNSTAVAISNMGLQEDYPNLELTQAFCRQLGYHRMRQHVNSWPAIPRLASHMIPQTWQRAISDRLPDGFHARILSREWYGGTDWSSTTVFPIPAYFLGFLRVNLRGREPQGLVKPGSEYMQLLKRVEDDLNRLTDPESGKPAIQYLARTVDHYHIDPHESLPDIFFDWAPTPYPKRRIEHPHTVLEQKDMFFSRDTRHDLCGFFAAAGPGITGCRRILNLSVLDIAPTCLRLMGQVVRDSMQGTVASEILA